MKIAILGCKGTTLDLISFIKELEVFSVDLVITLPAKIAQKNQVAFYKGVEIENLCNKNSIPIYLTNSYNLNDTKDVQFFLNEKIDLLIVIGWERLVPEAVLAALGKFACGMHGSAFGLPKGRGRSPLNWSLITGQKKFITYLFKYDPKIDAGNIIGFRSFEINDFDTIASLHMKNRIAMQDLLKTYIQLIGENREIAWPQPPEKPTFYPKRTPEDSAIDWNQRSMQIYNLIRAVLPPYPPAFCSHNNKKIYILDACPFDPCLFHNKTLPGTIVDISISLEQFVVKTLDGTILVKKFSDSSILDFKIGDVLESIPAEVVLKRIKNNYDVSLTDEEKEI
ncbi:MAG: formyltransferase family protein [Candidatus Margulisiibacteriota bacterium]